MAITSLTFLGFCICSILLFICFPRKYRWISLLISSIAFYLISAKWMIGFIILTSLLIWLAAKKIEAVEDETAEHIKNAGPDFTKEEKKAYKNQMGRKKKGILLTALIINIGILVLFKVFNYFTDAFNAIAGVFVEQEKLDAFSLILPLGISYYTFSTVGYLLDVYWKRYRSEQNFFRFFLFAIYYPHIVQGPISRYQKLGQELKKEVLLFKWDNFMIGIESILLGCFKKLVIADRVSIFVSNTYMAGDLKGSIYLLAIILDAIQIYTDFSGYMDIVLGVSKIMDIELEQNFNHPFLARTVPEFWRRWHMSLGSWFKDYVYYPLSVSSFVKKLNKKTLGWKSPYLKNIVAIIIPVMVTWVLTGLWHGTGSGYVAWGIYYGLLILLSVTFSDAFLAFERKIHIDTECFSHKFLHFFWMSGIFMGGRFLASGMSMAHRKEIIKSILTNFWDFDIYKYDLSKGDFTIIIIGFAILVAIAMIEKKETVYEWLGRQNAAFRAVIIWAFFFATFLLGIYGTAYSTSGFMYQQF